MTVSITNYSALDGKYTVHGTIGSGGFGKVKKGVHVVTGEKVAIKVMDKRTLGDDLPRAKLEIEALKNLRHQNICKLYEVVETETKIFMVLEHCSGGEMFDYIVERDRLEENEARFFFRQIVAAVAYIHSQGYAHRDLKPENLLLDEEQNIKLIDFGLCARPKGGMGVQLETFCGSPAYAAPELITGKEYLGSEADIWSLGVLLFTLLCGYLPFDDENMGTLYRKIQCGQYECPSWLSAESKNMISKMLQTDPKHRITVGSLLTHPWLNHGCGPEPIQWNSKCDKEGFDLDVVSEMALYFARSTKSILTGLKQWKYDYLMSTYFLLLNKKRAGTLFSLSCCNTPIKISHRLNWELSSSLESGLNNADLLLLGSPKRDLDSSSQSSSDSLTIRTIVTNKKQNPEKADKVTTMASAHTTEKASDKENFALPTSCPPSANKKRGRTPAAKSKHSGGASGTRDATVCTVSHEPNNHDDLFQSPSLFTPIEKRCWSLDLDIPESSIDIEKPQPRAAAPIPVTATPGKSSSAKHKVFGSIERRMDKVRYMLTPKRKGDTQSVPPPASLAPTPRKIKVKPTGLYNVSVVGRSNKGRTPANADEVLDTLQKALESKGIPCNRKGYILRNKIRNDQTGKVILAFELEICRLQAPSSHASAPTSPDVPLLGVCRKRLKGDTWIYKNVVEEVLKVLNHSG